MSDLLTNCPEAGAWINEVKAEYATSKIYEEIRGSVIWTNAVGADGKLLVPLEPALAVEAINRDDFPLRKGHDPGLPVGEVLKAATFTALDGTVFIAAVLGLYGNARLSFADIDLDPAPEPQSSGDLPWLPEACWLNVGTDPREIEPAWIEDILRDAPVSATHTVLSNNAAQATNELIVFGLALITLFANSFFQTLGSEAAKDGYAAIKGYLRTFLGKLAERKNPIFEVQGYHDECCISFIFRGTDVSRHYLAYDALPLAVARAATMAAKMKASGYPANQLVYEFHAEDLLWVPSFAILKDGRLVTDNCKLIAIEQLPSGLSIGMAARPVPDSEHIS